MTQALLSYPSKLQIAMMLCECCSNIFGEKTLDHWLAKTVLVNGFLVVSGDKWLQHQHSSIALREAAAASCYVCFHVLRRFPDLTAPTMYTICVSPPKQEFRHLEILPKPLVGGRSSGATFRLKQINEASQACALSKLSLSEPNTGEAHCLALATYWLDDCCRRHQRCSANKSPAWYPTRLLALDAHSIRLVETSMSWPSGPYATLSHCWGTHPIDVLAPANIAEHKGGRLIQDLPPSFRDFCKISQSLGIFYVWIDSFCILQGPSPESVKDWERQSVLMEKVYSNSLINIGASQASSSQGGCFQDRGDSVRTHSMYWKACKTDPDQAYYALFEWLDNPKTEFNRLHLFSRAWVVQERLLAPRMLHFGGGQLWWQCAEEPLLCEKDMGSPQRSTCTSINHVRPAGIDEYQGRLHELWNGAMNVYSRCGLTMPHTDKHRAIQGIGDRIATLTGDNFMEGFFWSQLPRALCWQVSHAVSQDRDRLGRAQRYRAPSWSWVSMDCELYFDAALDRSRAGELLAAAVCITSSGARKQDSRRFLVCIGKILSLCWLLREKDLQARLNFASCSGTLLCVLDDPDADTYVQSADLVFLPIVREIDEEPLPSISGLVLSKCSDGTWARVGMSYSGSYENDVILQELRATTATVLILC